MIHYDLKILRWLFKIGLFFFIITITSCFSHKEVFHQTLTDGTTVTGSRMFSHKKENKYFIVSGKNEKEKTHIEFFINRFSCDTIIKKIFKKRMVKILFLTEDIKPDYPISEDDIVVYKKAAAFLSVDNKNYLNFINKATGYKIVYDGKVDNRRSF